MVNEEKKAKATNGCCYPCKYFEGSYTNKAFKKTTTTTHDIRKRYPYIRVGLPYVTPRNVRRGDAHTEFAAAAAAAALMMAASTGYLKRAFHTQDGKSAWAKYFPVRSSVVTEGRPTS